MLANAPVMRLCHNHRPFSNATPHQRTHTTTATARSCPPTATHHHPSAKDSEPTTTAISSHHLLRTALASSLAALQLCAGVLTPLAALPPSAHAVLNSPNAQIPRTVDAALRRSIPAFNEDVLGVQRQLEAIAFKLRIPQRKPWPNMAGDAAAALGTVQDEARMMYGVPPAQRQAGQDLIAAMQSGLNRLQVDIAAKDADRVSVRVAGLLQQVAELELMQAPGIPFIIPKEYQNMPRLTGRATVELTIERPDGSLAFFDGSGDGPKQQARVRLMLDGYSAPLSAGAFAANVADGLYNGRALEVNYASVYAKATEPSSKLVPLEILPMGDFEPIYKSSLDVQSGELPVLPLSIYGAVSMAHVTGPQADQYLSGDEFFLYKYDRQQAGLAGLAFDEGQFGVFGYVVQGVDLVPYFQNGDVIVRAEIIAGGDKLVRPGSG